MKTIPELLNLYEAFFKKLGEKFNTDPNDPVVRSEAFEKPNEKDIDELEKKFHIKVPKDIRTFWKALDRVYEAGIYDDDNWSAGWDFMKLEYVARETMNLRNNVKNMDDDYPSKKLHETGISLTFSEPILLFDSKTGSMHYLLWDGEPIPDAITLDFATFFEHWLASGCYYQGEFDKYFEQVKDIVPVSVPVKDNLWIQYRNKYNRSPEADVEKEANSKRLEDAYEQTNEAITIWRDGNEKEATALMEKVIAVGKELDEWDLVGNTICNYAGLTSESGRNKEGLKILQEFIKKNKEEALGHPRFMCLLGQYLYEEGKAEEGLEMCNIGLKVGPMYGMGYYTRACAHVRLQNYKESVADIANAIKFSPALKEDIVNDKDFAPLRSMPDYIKIMKN